jgi:hypothetical protein
MPLAVLRDDYRCVLNILIVGGATGGIAAVAGQQSAGAGGVGELFSASRPGW